MAGMRLLQGVGCSVGGFSPCVVVEFENQYPPNSYDVQSGALLTLMGGWQSGVYSTGLSVLSVGDSASFTIGEFQFIAGLTSNVAPISGWTEIDFGFYCASPSQCHVRENNTFVAIGACSVGDRLRMVVNGVGLMEFFVNGALVHTSSVAVAATLYPHFTGGNNNSAVSAWEVCQVPANVVRQERVARVVASPDILILEEGYISIAGEVVVPSVEELSILHGYEIDLDVKGISKKKSVREAV